MLERKNDQYYLSGPTGSFKIPDEDEITIKLAMIYEGECEPIGPLKAAKKYGFSKQRYFQLRNAFRLHGAASLQSQPRGPKTQYRRTQELVRQIIRHRFLDPDACVEAIAQKLKQTGHLISIRSVERVVADYGLQKKLYELNPKQPACFVQTQRTRRKERAQPADPKSLERQVRQLLADKISGTQVGLWLLIPEHLRLGTWDLLCGWTGCPAQSLQPRLALQFLLEITQKILAPAPTKRPVVVADCEHFNSELIEKIQTHTVFDLLIPMPNQKGRKVSQAKVPASQFTAHWAGFATATQPFNWHKANSSKPLFEIIQRSGEKPEDYHFKSFLATKNGSQVVGLCVHFPQRWHIEEFFKFNQAFGWQKAGTLNLSVRYGQMTLALIAQTVIHQLRQRLGEPHCTWDANHLAKDVLAGLEGDVRVHDDTIVVTYYNVPNVELLRKHYENLPEKLVKDGVNPKITWLYNFKLDFRFK